MTIAKLLGGSGIGLVLASALLPFLPSFAPAVEAGPEMSAPEPVQQDVVVAVFTAPLAFERPAALDEARIDPQPEQALSPVRSSEPRLYGIANQTGEDLAWIALDGSAVVRVGLDGTIGDWRIIRIDQTEVEVVNDERSLVLQLFGGAQ
jgi:hypothetical protein